MKTHPSNLAKIILDDYEFTIPRYQRQYEWPDERIKVFCEDIISLSGKRENLHWMGTMVRQWDGEASSGAKTYLVIDGQQRITALLIFISGIREYLLTENIFQKVEQSDPNAKTFYEVANEFGGILKNRLDSDRPGGKIHLKEVVNRGYLYTHGTDGAVTRLFNPTEDDQEGALAIIYGEGQIDGRLRHSRHRVKVVDILRKAHVGLSIEQVLKSINGYLDALERMQILFLDLQNEDDAQQVFESINYKGEPLSAVDIIRNYVIGLPTAKSDRQQMYMNVWEPMQSRLKQVLGKKDSTERRSLYDDFFKTYVCMCQQDSADKKVFSSFKSIIEKACADRSTFEALNPKLSELRGYSVAFEKLTSGYSAEEITPTLREKVRYFSRLGFMSPFSLLIRMHGPGEKCLIGEDEMIKVFNVLESYFVRRALLGRSVRGMSDFFSTLSFVYHSSPPRAPELPSVWLKRMLHHVAVDLNSVDREPREDREVDPVYKLIESKQDFTHLKPISRTEFLSEMPSAQAYSNSANVTRFALYAIERSMSTSESVDVESSDIEHVLPQDNKPWRDDINLWNPGSSASPVQRLEVALSLQDTIGNLTLTNFNKSLKNKRFIEKRDLVLQRKDGSAEQVGYRYSNLKLNKQLAFIDPDAKDLVLRESWSFEDIRLRSISLSAKLADLYRFTDL